MLPVLDKKAYNRTNIMSYMYGIYMELCAVSQMHKNCSVLMTNEMHNYNQFLFHIFFLLYMFQMNLVVHHQEHGIIYCIRQFCTIMQVSLAALKL